MVFSVPRYPRPVNVTLPVITGTARVGEVLTASLGTWFGNPSFYVVTWFRGATSVATSTTYTVTTADISSTLYVRVEATNSFGSTSAFSAETAIVSPASSAGDVLLLENNDRLALDGTTGVLLLDVPVTSTGFFLLLESGDKLLLESGARLVLDQIETPTDAILDVNASYILDTNGDYIRGVA